jgi:hypothetical protein
VYVETSYRVPNTPRRYDDWLLDSCYFDNEECFFLDSVVGQVDHFALEDVAAVQIHQYFQGVGDVDVKNSEGHPLILQLYIARFGKSDIVLALDIRFSTASLVPLLKLSLHRQTVQKQNVETIGGRNARPAIE